VAYNNLSGTVLLPVEMLPRLPSLTAIVSGNLSTSDGANVINVPRVSNANNNSLITNVGGDANTLTCESNLTFDGDTLNITGDLTASVGVSASYFRGDGSYLTGISGTGDQFTVNGIGDTNGNLIVGFNYGSAAFTGARNWRTPEAPTVGDVVRVKAPDGVSSTNNLTVIGYADHTIDGLANVSIESPFGALALCYVSSGSYRIF